jgi:hypothetical protein
MDTMPLNYRSGEEVQAGDRILYASEPGTIEFVASANNPETAWYVEQFGGGCMILSSCFGRVFVSDPHDDEDLEFVARDGAPPG